MRILLVVILAFLPLTGNGEIYKRVLPDGQVIYTDQPDPDAEKIVAPPIQTYTPPAAPRPDTPTVPSSDMATTALSYTSAAITAPAQDEVIWDNEGTVPVSIEIDPPLQVDKGHQLTLLLDGAKVADLTQTIYTLHGVERGTHTLQVTIRDAEGVVFDSPTITFHLKRHVAAKTTPH
jgi:hypothetical protein